jgi:hypothetical protein
MQEREQQMALAAAADGETATTAASSNHHHHHSPKTLQHQAMEIAAATKKSQQQNGRKRRGSKKSSVTPKWVYALLIVFAILTIVTIPVPFHPTVQEGPTVRHVFYYGWLTAMSTGLGALPFLLFPDVATFWIGISNGTYYFCCGCCWFF